MTDRKTVLMPDGRIIDISKVEATGVEFVTNVLTRATPEFSKTQYGHAAMILAVAAIGAGSIEEMTAEERGNYLRKCAQEKIDQFGPEIIPFLRDELRLSLDGE